MLPIKKLFSIKLKCHVVNLDFIIMACGMLAEKAFFAKKPSFLNRFVAFIILFYLIAGNV